MRKKAGLEPTDIVEVYYEPLDDGKQILENIVSSQVCSWWKYANCLLFFVSVALFISFLITLPHGCFFSSNCLAGTIHPRIPGFFLATSYFVSSPSCQFFLIFYTQYFLNLIWWGLNLLYLLFYCSQVVFYKEEYRGVSGVSFIISLARPALIFKSEAILRLFSGCSFISN